MKPAVLITLHRGAKEIAEALLERANLEIVTLYEDTVEPMRKKGIPCTWLIDYVSGAEEVLAAREAAWRAERIERELDGPAMRREWPSLGNDPEAWARVREGVSKTIRRDFYKQIVMIDALRGCSRALDLRLVIVHQDICMDTKTVVYGARQLGIASLHTIHGYYYGTKNMHAESFCDMVSVPAEPMKTLFEGFGVPEDRVVVTGNFEWDCYASPPPPGLREKGCATLGLDPERPIVTYALTYPHKFSAVSVAYFDYAQKTVEAVIRAFGALSKKYPDWQFVVRPHPNDPDAPKELHLLFEEIGLEAGVVDSELSAPAAVDMADVLACTQSNLGAEAVFSGKPVVNCVIEALGGPVFREGMGPLFIEEDAVLMVRHEGDIAKAIEGAMLDPDVRADLKGRRAATALRFNHLNDGKAMERLCELALDMVANCEDYVTPISRWPEVERMLAEGIPEGAERILAVGSRYGADAAAFARPNADVVYTQCVGAHEGGGFDAVVLSAPLPPSAEAETLMRKGLMLSRDGGCVIAWFRNAGCSETGGAYGAEDWCPPREGGDAASFVGQYSRIGIDVLLSRCDAEALSVHELKNAARHVAPEETQSSAAMTIEEGADVVAWVVRIGEREESFHPWEEDRAARRRRACAANERGEALFAQGDYHGASSEFSSAIAEWDREAVFYSNLGTALHAMGHREGAWEKIVQALHFNPSLQSARDNLRAIGDLLGRRDEADHMLGLFGEDLPSE